MCGALAGPVRRRQLIGPGRTGRGGRVGGRGLGVGPALAPLGAKSLTRSHQRPPRSAPSARAPCLAHGYPAPAWRTGARHPFGARVPGTTWTTDSTPGPAPAWLPPWPVLPPFKILNSLMGRTRTTCYTWAGRIQAFPNESAPIRKDPNDVLYVGRADRVVSERLPNGSERTRMTCYTWAGRIGSFPNGFRTDPSGPE